MPFFKYIATFLLFFALCAQHANAAMVDPLNEITIPISDRSPQQFQQALKTAFPAVLIKMSGNTQIMKLPAIQSATNNIQQWVQSYSYTTQPSLQLQITFDQSALKNLLDNTGQTMWHRDRPLTLIYFQTTDLDLLKTLQANTTAIAKTLNAPIIFPELDLSDQTITGDLNPAVFLTTQQMQALSQRYGVLSFLDGQISQQLDQTGNTHWRGRFSFLLNGQTFQWTVSGITQENVITAALNNMVRAITGQSLQDNNTDTVSNDAQTNAAADTTASTLTMEVSGVNDISDYAKITRYLKQVPGVTTVNVKDMNPAGMLLQITLKTTRDEFQKILTSDHQLQPLEGALKPADHSADLYYSWGVMPPNVTS